MDTDLIFELDALVSREALPGQRPEYLIMLHHGFKYADTFSGSEEGLRGFKYVTLAKAVTTGRLRSDASRSVKETLGRIRLVNAGRLRPLVEEMFRDATAVTEEEALRSAAVAAELAAVAETEAAAEAVRARSEAISAAASSGLLLSEAELEAVAERAAERGRQGARAKAAASEGAAQLGEDLDSERTLRKVLRYCAAGYLSKGYAQFRASPLADASKSEVREELRRLHPQSVPPTAEEVPDEEGVQALVTDKKHFNKIFAAPPQERGISLDATSYEELQQLFHGGHFFRATLYSLVCKINAGTLHPAAARVLGESLLVGLEKPDGSTRPIGVGAALRRLAGRVIMLQEGERMGKVFTTTKPSRQDLEAAGWDGDRWCNTPLQLGCGIKGGAEIAVGISRLGLQLKAEWAILSDDKKNGFNAITRAAIERGLRRWFPELIPTFRLFYARHGRLFTVSKDGRRAATDGEGAEFFSAEGCTQGDSMGRVPVPRKISLLALGGKRVCVVRPRPACPCALAVAASVRAS
jgi:hypothetical protein